MKGRIVLVTSGQPSLNPRLVKEADALSDAGYNVQVVYQEWSSWGSRMDQVLLASRPWKCSRSGGARSSGRAIYWFTRVVHKFGRRLAAWSLNPLTAVLAIGRGAWLLRKAAASWPADLYLAHNLAALPAAVYAARKNKARCGFDAEDFHRNEVSDDPAAPDVKLKTFLEARYFPQANFITASSEEIAARYRSLFPGKPITVIRNVFPKVAVNNTGSGNPLKLFWFSQTVGLSRGLQDVLGAMKLLENHPLEFHVLGQLPAAVAAGLESVVAGLNFAAPPLIRFHKPVHPDELPTFASAFDIGMATEPGFSINNDSALSNKLFTYLGSGLTVIASDTSAQGHFIERYPAAGTIYRRGDAESLAAVLSGFVNNRASLHRSKSAAKELASSELNWETESTILLDLVAKTLAKK